jgi:hypothetical protein
LRGLKSLLAGDDWEARNVLNELSRLFISVLNQSGTVLLWN